MLDKLREHLQSISKEEFLKEWEEIKAMKLEGVTVKELVSSWETRHSTKDLVYSLANNKSYQLLESELFKAVSKIIDLHVEFDRMFCLSPKQSNEVLEIITNHLKTQLFNMVPLHKTI